MPAKQIRADLLTRHLWRRETLVTALALLCCTVLYLHIAGIQSGVNSDMFASDQSAYIDFAREAHETRLQYTGGRNRMPLFPWLMALTWSPEMTDQAFFDTGKRLNVWLSLLLLAGISAAFFAKFSRLYAGYAMLCITFLVFVLKSPFFQAEILYYGLFAFAFMVSVSGLSAPSWRKSLLAGLLFGLAHFTKASALPALLIYCSSLVILGAIRLLQRQSVRNAVSCPGSHALLALLGFVALLFPYLQESYENYGSHFYNVNTTFYVWYDSWGEARTGTKAAGDRVGYPDLPPDEIPRLEKYLSEHTPQQIVERFRVGVERLVAFGCTREDSIHRYGYCSQVAAGLVLLAFSLPLLLRHYPSQLILAAGHIIFFVTAILLVYALGAAWYMPISGNKGPRVLLVLSAPFFWTLGLVVHSSPVQTLRLRFGQGSVSAFHLVYGLLSLMLVYEIYLVVTVRAATMYGGK